MTPILFDSALIQARQQRFAKHWREHGVLHGDMAARLVERLQDVRQPLPDGLILGDRHGVVAAALAGSLTQWQTQHRQNAVILDFARLHVMNDVVGELIQARQALRPDGLYLGVFVGGESFTELRHALHATELALHGGVSARVHPMIDVRDAGALLQRAGFAMPVADVDTLVLDYSHPMYLLQDIRRVGAANALLERRKQPVSRTFWAEFCRRYQENFTRADGRVTATVQLIFLSGWAPAASQPKAIARGSATTSFKDVL